MTTTTIFRFSLSIVFDALTIADMARLMGVAREFQQFIIDNMEYGTADGGCVADKFMKYALCPRDVGHISTLQKMCEIDDWIFKYVVTRADDPEKMRCIDINAMLCALMRDNNNNMRVGILHACEVPHEAFDTLYGMGPEVLVCISSPIPTTEPVPGTPVPRIVSDLEDVRPFKTDRGEFVVRLNTIIPNFQYVGVGLAHVNPQLVYLRSRHADRPEPTCLRSLRFRSMCDMDMAHFSEWAAWHGFEFIM